MIPCPEPDCKAPVIHWHDIDGHILACHSALNGKPCPHGSGGLPCHTPRETSPMHLPDVEDVAMVIYESDFNTNWDGASEGVKDSYRRNAQAALDLIANRQPVWKRLEPGTKFEVGQRYRVEYAHGHVSEDVSRLCWTVPDNRDTYYVLRTPDAPETRDSIIREFAAELDRIYTERTAGDSTWIGVLGTLVNRIDALGGEDK